MLVTGLYVIIDRTTGLFYNGGELKKVPKIYTKKGANRLIEEYKRAKKKKYSYYFDLHKNKIPYYCHGKTSSTYFAKYDLHICILDMVECKLSTCNCDHKGYRRGCVRKA